MDLLEGRKALQRDLARLDAWAQPSWVRVNKAKGRVLPWGHHNPTQRSRRGAEGLESCPAEKALGGLVERGLDRSQQGAQVAKRASGILAWIRSGVASRSRAGTVPLCWALGGPPLDCWGQGWAPPSPKALGGLERVQRRAAELGRGLEPQAAGERLGELGGFSLEQRRLRGALIAPYNGLRGGGSRGGWLCSQGRGDGTRGNGLKLCQGRVRLAMGNNSFPQGLSGAGRGCPGKGSSPHPGGDLTAGQRRC